LEEEVDAKIRLIRLNEEILYLMEESFPMSKRVGATLIRQR